MGKDDKKLTETANTTAPLTAAEDEGYQTVVELEEDYPELVAEIRAAEAARVQEETGAELRKKLEKKLRDEITAQVRAELAATPGHLQVKGFLLAVDDPFAAGTARDYAALKEMAVPALPCVLPEKDKQTPAAVARYILRADGGGDRARAAAAREFLQKSKK